MVELSISGWAKNTRCSLKKSVVVVCLEIMATLTIWLVGNSESDWFIWKMSSTSNVSKF